MKKDFKLSDLPKHNIYQVPEDYFDRLPMRVMERTAGAAQARDAATWQPAGWVRALRMAIAPAVLSLVFAGVFYLQKVGPANPETASLTAVSDQAIVNYLDTYAILESGDLAELHTLGQQELHADLLNVSPKAAEAELEYYELNSLDY